MQIDKLHVKCQIAYSVKIEEKYVRMSFADEMWALSSGKNKKNIACVPSAYVALSLPGVTIFTLSIRTP